MKENVVFEKSKVFALRIVNLYKYLCMEKKETILSKQMLRSGTSIGANVAESICSVSTKDLLAKLYIAFKECSETLYWLELLSESGYLDEKEYRSIQSDCSEIYRLLSAITKTLREQEKVEH